MLERGVATELIAISKGQRRRLQAINMDTQTPVGSLDAWLHGCPASAAPPRALKSPFPVEARRERSKTLSEPMPIPRLHNSHCARAPCCHCLADGDGFMVPGEAHGRMLVNISDPTQMQLESPIDCVLESEGTVRCGRFAASPSDPLSSALISRQAALAIQSVVVGNAVSAAAQCAPLPCPCKARSPFAAAQESCSTKPKLDTAALTLSCNRSTPCPDVGQDLTSVGAFTHSNPVSASTLTIYEAQLNLGCCDTEATTRYGRLFPTVGARSDAQPISRGPSRSLASPTHFIDTAASLPAMPARATVSLASLCTALSSPASHVTLAGANSRCCSYKGSKVQAAAAAPATVISAVGAADAATAAFSRTLASPPETSNRTAADSAATPCLLPYIGGPQYDKSTLCTAAVAALLPPIERNNLEGEAALSSRAASYLPILMLAHQVGSLDAWLESPYPGCGIGIPALQVCQGQTRSRSMLGGPSRSLPTPDCATASMNAVRTITCKSTSQDAAGQTASTTPAPDSLQLPLMLSSQTDTYFVVSRGTCSFKRKSLLSEQLRKATSLPQTNIISSDQSPKASAGLGKDPDVLTDKGNAPERLVAGACVLSHKDPTAHSPDGPAAPVCSSSISSGSRVAAAKLQPEKPAGLHSRCSNISTSRASPFSNKQPLLMVLGSCSEDIDAGSSACGGGGSLCCSSSAGCYSSSSNILHYSRGDRDDGSNEPLYLQPQPQRLLPLLQQDQYPGSGGTLRAAACTATAAAAGPPGEPSPPPHVEATQRAVSTGQCQEPQGFGGLLERGPSSDLWSPQLGQTVPPCHTAPDTPPAPLAPALISAMSSPATATASFSPAHVARASAATTTTSSTPEDKSRNGLESCRGVKDDVPGGGGGGNGGADSEAAAGSATDLTSGGDESCPGSKSQSNAVQLAVAAHLATACVDVASNTVAAEAERPSEEGEHQPAGVEEGSRRGPRGVCFASLFETVLVLPATTDSGGGGGAHRVVRPFGVMDEQTLLRHSRSMGHGVVGLDRSRSLGGLGGSLDAMAAVGANAGWPETSIDARLRDVVNARRSFDVSKAMSMSRASGGGSSRRGGGFFGATAALEAEVPPVMYEGTVRHGLPRKAAAAALARTTSQPISDAVIRPLLFAEEVAEDPTEA
ncbi:hypothetical protein VOLCADRAFT_94589 [Volvox carteri f. nagariensis]|uniref:Uncharacterized protein n=1 Tax=Volvox carteri f. nagariensis TaxID=3068 RepID=D8U569_VOLCA|nr:uncharacterized protein VOLCADRAFT_94589 [Volvox carteri f. nagariensis]EFJ45097.1 hypothetical protein VOLCADRAFT_94589 [Volvox carteri f. nagariensis]|eukprot:XP_002953773.1 hypothetical protein VOLCADRAFT_94589 [Volvox carteri f. nagariensis]